VARTGINCSACEARDERTAIVGHRSVRARSAAGVTWALVIANAPWGRRAYHTSVVDAAGAIYVIGGYGTGRYRDVWASTDGGARPDCVKGLVVEGTPGSTTGD
jgi:hypothetical protein